MGVHVEYLRAPWPNKKSHTRCSFPKAKTVLPQVTSQNELIRSKKQAIRFRNPHCWLPGGLGRRNKKSHRKRAFLNKEKPAFL
jgi:hypothetical protein